MEVDRAFLNFKTQIFSSRARAARNRLRVKRLGLVHKLERVLDSSIAPASFDGFDKSEEARKSVAHHFGDLASALAQASEPIASYIRSWRQNSMKAPGKRLPDIYPVPPLDRWPSCVQLCAAIDESVCLQVANLCLGALSCLNGGLKAVFENGSMNVVANSAQRSVQLHVAARAARFLFRLNGTPQGDFSWQGAFSTFESSGTSNCQPIRSCDVDLSCDAAVCDPCPLISEELRDLIENPEKIFQGELGNACQSATVAVDHREEYARLVIRELQCGKLRLR